MDPGVTGSASTVLDPDSRGIFGPVEETFPRPRSKQAVRTQQAGRLDKPWTRTLPARVVRGAVIRGVFGTIIDAYARQEIVGDDRLAHLRGPAIFVANHSSHVDTPVLLRSLRARWRRRTVVAAAADYFYAKRLLGCVVSLAFGAVPLERRLRGAGIHASAHIQDLIDGGWNIVVFAEGTRSRDGRVGVMRSGAAVLAARHGVPLIPVHISGTHAAMPPGRGWLVRPEGGGRRGRHAIRVSFGAPIHVDSAEECLEAMESVRQFMEVCGADTTVDPRLASHRSRSAAKAAAAPADDALRTITASHGRSKGTRAL